MKRPPTEAWGVTPELSRLKGGHRNQVWRTHGLSQDLVFKSTRREDAAIAWLLPVLQCARDVGLGVPEMLATTQGRWICQGWTCETFLEGSHVPRGGVAELAEGIAQFHFAMEGMSQRPGFLSSSALIVAMRGGDVDLSHMPSDLVKLCRSAWEAIMGDTATVVHGDISPGNVLRQPDGRLALVDWDECRCDFVFFDRVPFGRASDAEQRAHLAWELACSWKREPGYARDLARMLRAG